MGELDRILRVMLGEIAGQRGGLGSMTDLEMREPVGIGRMTENEMMSNPSGLGSMSEYELAQMMQPRGIGNLSASEAGLLGSILGDSSGLGMTTERENELMNQANRRLQQLKALEEKMLLQRLIR
tara:strand:- start:3379 stop:3753 length:375 start_codon:yes stop_codon:yes gene_type:complete